MKATFMVAAGFCVSVCLSFILNFGAINSFASPNKKVFFDYAKKTDPPRNDKYQNPRNYKNSDPFINHARATWSTLGKISLVLPDNVRGYNLKHFLYYGDYHWDGGKIISANPIPLKKTDDWGGTVILQPDTFLKSNMNDVIREKIQVVTKNQYDEIIDITNVQLAGILDEKFYYEGDDLGVTFQNGTPTLKLWAPTAKEIVLHLYSDAQKSNEKILPLTLGDKGVWSIAGQSDWVGKFYLYEITVFMPQTGQVETNFVTDPYAPSFSLNSQKSQIVDMTDPSLKPNGWDSFQKPPLSSLNDISLYEMHIRDYTIADPTLPEFHRGTFLAFTDSQSNSMRHLRSMAEAGLTHVHLLPILDFVTVDEEKSRRMFPQIPENAPRDSATQQESIGMVRSQDSYNWGYDPFNYFAPEGSYAVNPQNRIWEARSMVKALSDMGLRVVLDVVFNHTFSSGLSQSSVFDKVVPGYFYRLDNQGRVYNSSCCSDTASENKMMEKLMIDALKFWARHYKIDGFRFDLMNLHSKENMRNILKVMRSLTISKDGIDGSKLYFYGEGWNFGSLEATHPGQSFHQLNSYGFGIGTFNDRIRDAIRGGTTDTKEKSDQGFATGLFYDYNQEPANANTPGDLGQQREKLLVLGDVIRMGLAGNLRDYHFTDFKGNWIKAGQHYFRGNPTAYAASPVETINYVSAHDGYTLWDAVNAKAPFFTRGRVPTTATSYERTRIQMLSLALVSLSQGVPFYESGSEILKSKCGDQDSYDSGDWFNLIDFSFKSNNWGHGLPVAWKNRNDWVFWQPRLVNRDLEPTEQEILFAKEYFNALLRVRKSSPLFKLRSLEEIQSKVSFLDGKRANWQIPGLIVMDINDDNGIAIDRRFKRIVSFFNANNSYVTFFDESLLNQDLVLHDDLNVQVDNQLLQVAYRPREGTVGVPPKTTAVFYIPRR